MEDANDQDVVPFTSIVDEVTAIALHAIAATQACVAWSDFGELQQALKGAFQPVDVDAGLVLAEVRACPLEDRSEVCFSLDRKDEPRADTWLEAR
jgi:hypothetical protein